MKMNGQFEGKQVLIIGLAKSGYSAAKLLRERGAQVVVNDIASLNENSKAMELREIGVEIIGGSHPLSLLEREFSFIVKNPGIRYDNQLISEAMKRDIPVITEVELAWMISKTGFIGITGSNGKTTTTTLIYEMLKGGRKKPLLAGNIGTAVSEVVTKATNNHIVVTELSSFQLMGVIEFQPEVAVLLNIYAAHLDYHGTLEAYISAKSNLINKQRKGDVIIYNADDPTVTKMVTNHKGPLLIPFSRRQFLEKGACIANQHIYYNGTPIIPIETISLPGDHNLENILAAVATAKWYGINNDWIQQILINFRGVPHRLEYIRTVAGRDFYNDSKATNLLATEKAIMSFHEPIILIAGGLDRGHDFDELIPIIKERVKAVISYGETAEKINLAAKEAGVCKRSIVTNIEEAVDQAYEFSQKNDVILLSPACASWDQFKTFEERGDMFRKCVHKLKV